MTSLYERLGEREGIRTVVDAFYDSLVDDAEIGHFFEDADLEELRRTQTTFLSEAAGGPESYDAAPVRAAHSDVEFEPADIRRALDLLDATLERHGVAPEDAADVVAAVAAYQDDLVAEG